MVEALLIDKKAFDEMVRFVMKAMRRAFPKTKSGLLLKLCPAKSSKQTQLKA